MRVWGQTQTNCASYLDNYQSHFHEYHTVPYVVGGEGIGGNNRRKKREEKKEGEKEKGKGRLEDAL